ncbi:MAG TPA: DUF4430 domain-containing protein [Solirubrobacteraceae bacterium]|nr:DUF4430 domain-containing protein [Solirubrobacteraceae bacterium]
MKSAAAPALLGCVLALAGCGLGAGAAPSAVRLLVTRDFGARVLDDVPRPKLAGEETVMSLLLRNDSVTTRFGGGFVQSIGGLDGGTEGSRPVDWFYYVNGIQAEKGAAETKVHPGDHIWWDRHDWSQTEDVPAVVGSYPEPFLNGTGGKRLPVRVECSTDAGGACRAVTHRLQADGVPAATSALGAGGGTAILRVLVGSWAALRADSGAAPIERGPRASGVYATFGAAGRTLTLLDPDGRGVQTLSAGAGLIAATRNGEEAPVWVVTGTDPAGVQRAAADFAEAPLHNRFALAVGALGAVPLPDSQAPAK